MKPGARLILIILMVFVARVGASENPAVSCILPDGTPGYEELRRTALSLISVPRNRTLDSIDLKASVEALYASRRFERVEVEQTDEGIAFLLTPARYIRDIRISGEYPLFGDEVEKAMSTYPGDVYVPDNPGQQDSLITALYLREGFVSPRVTVTSEPHRTGTDRVIHVRIDAGEYYRMSGLEIRGNRAFSAVRIKAEMKSWRTSLIPGSAGRFVEAVLREDLRNLTERYRSRGFADVVIGDSVMVDSTRHEIRVVVSIDEGDHYRIRFSRRWDRGFRKSVLRRDLTLFRTGNRNNLGVRQSIKAMEKRFREAGYLEAQVKVEEKTVERKGYTDRIVRFSAKRGPRTTVSSISFSGVGGLDEELLRGQMLHVDRGGKGARAFDPDKLQDDVAAIQMLYHSRGFLRAAVASTVDIKGFDAAITIHVQEGPRTQIGMVSVDTQRFPDIDPGTIMLIRTGNSFRNDLVRRDARAIQSVIAEQGYPHAAVTPIVNFNEDSTRADIEFSIAEGPRVILGDFQYVGAFRTQDRVLRREHKAVTGEPLSLKDIVETQKRIRDLGLFNSVRFRTIGLREQRDTVQVFVEVAEKRPYYGTLGGGYESEKDFFVHTRVGDRNMFGLNKEAWIGGELNRIGEAAWEKRDPGLIGYRGELAMVDPRLLGTPLRAQIGVSGEKSLELNPFLVTKTYGVSALLAAPVLEKMVLGLGTAYERRRSFTESGNAPSSDSISSDQRPRNVIAMTPSLVWDRRDSFTRPRKGTFTGASVDISNSIGTTLDDFLKVRLEAKGYVTPFKSLTLAGVVRAGSLHPYGGAKDVALDQRLFLGGRRDVRGFKDNLLNWPDTTGGKASLSAGIEARIDLRFNLEPALFLDVGRLSNNWASIALDQFRASIGMGIRYHTPIGPIGIVYGWKLPPKRGEVPGALHFSLGYSF